LAAPPYAAIETVFLDVGNTLVSVDFARVAREVSAAGLACAVPELRRAEAAARPAVSARIAAMASTETGGTFRFYLRAVLLRLPAAAQLDASRVEALADAIAPSLREPGRGHRLWCWELPGVRDALAALRGAGLRLVAVSNSDGTVEEGLEALGLRALLDAVHDSHLVGFEKPDPRLFEHALRGSGAEPERTLHVGDLYHADVVGARAAGIHAVLLDPFGDWPEMDCERLPDLPAVAEQLLRAPRRPRSRP
jgi:FMN phosphatase YigB (HAD superfamily)